MAFRDFGTCQCYYGTPLESTGHGASKANRISRGLRAAQSCISAILTWLRVVLLAVLHRGRNCPRNAGK